MYKIYKAKSIVNTHKHCDGGWFWDKYSAHPYTGCEYGCDYCYSREEKYNPYRGARASEIPRLNDPFSELIKIKENAPELLRRELKNKPRDLIYLDSYQPVEAKYRYVRKMLEVCLELGFPVFINEKSPMLLRDLDILKEISRSSHLNVGWSIITAADDAVRLAFEPKAPPVSARFEAMKKLAENNIMTGTVFMPMLPFIYDDEANIEAVVKKTKECGGQYVLDGGLTLQGNCRTHFYKALERFDPTLLTRYDELYGDSELMAKHARRVHQSVLTCCRRHGLDPFIPRPIDLYPKELQINKRVAARFYLEARELQLSGQGGYREWAYRKAAWALDDLDESVQKILRARGLDGLMQNRGIGESLAKQIQEFSEGEHASEPTCR